MNLNSSIEVYQDVSFQLDLKFDATLRENLARRVFAPWHTDPEWERYVQKWCMNEERSCRLLHGF